MTKAVNAVRDGSIIANTEERLPYAHAVFREQFYARAVSLLQSKQEVFVPPAPRAAEQGPSDDDASDG